MPPAGFEPAIPASERPQTHALGGANKPEKPEYNQNQTNYKGNYLYNDEIFIICRKH
jgi:hypothetical protein